MSVKVVIQNGSFQKPDGTLLANGTLVLRLSQDATVSATAQVVSKAPITITLDASGQAPATAVWGNDVLSPSGTVYYVDVFDSTGKPAANTQSWSIAGAGPIELNTMVRTDVGPTFPAPVLQSPTGDQTVVTHDLLPALGNVTQALGSTAAPWQASLFKLTSKNTGVFTDTQQNLYNQFLLNGTDPASEWNGVFTPGNQATEAVTAGSTVPNGATVFQNNAIAGYVHNKNGPTTAGVALFGMATASDTNNGRIWGINALATSVAGKPSNSIYAAEFDANVTNTGDVATGVLITGFFSTQPTISIALDIEAPQNTGFWPYGIRFEQGATTTPTSNGAAIYFFPIASGVNQISQGLSFLSNDPTSGQHLGTLWLSPAGAHIFTGNGMGVSSSAITPAGMFHSQAGVTSALVPTITSSGAAVIGDTNETLGTGSGKVYGVIGVAKATADAIGDRAYGGWFKANASAHTDTEVGIHAETSDAGGSAAEFGSGGTINTTIQGTGLITKYAGISTVANGVPSAVAQVNSTGLVAGTGTVTLYAVPASGAGQYRLSWNAKITAAGTSPVIGPLTIVYTDPDGSVCTMIIPSSNSAGAVSAAGNSANSATSTGVMLGSPVLLNCKASTNITYNFPVSGTVGTAAWNLHIRLESIG